MGPCIFSALLVAGVGFGALQAAEIEGTIVITRKLTKRKGICLPREISA